MCRLPLRLALTKSLHSSSSAFFQVLDKISVVAYMLDLPATSSIHYVFHASQLKTVVPTSHTVSMLAQALDGLQFRVKVL